MPTASTSRWLVSLALLLTLAQGGTAARASAALLIHADDTLPHPPPSAPLDHWAAAPGRVPVTLALDGATARGYAYAGSDGSAPALLFFNGNGTTVDRNDAMYRSLAATGPRVVVFDYRGFGFSTGAADLPTFQLDAVRIYDTLAVAGPVVVYGYSMGCAMASYVAARRPVAGLVLAAPAPSASAELNAFVESFPGAFPAGAAPAPDATAVFAEAAFVADSAAPLLIVHGTADRAVPIALGRAVFAASTAKIKAFVPLAGVPHNGTPSAGQARSALHDFIRLLEQSP